MKKKTLSVIIPVYNESATIERVIAAVERADIGVLNKEIIVVDDGSTDGTREILERVAGEGRCRLFGHAVNRGKGAAVRLGFSKAAGDFLIIQDADLEYDPGEYSLILRPLLDGKADVVFGSRFVGSGPHRVLLFWHYLGNRLLTTFSNIFTNLNLSDMEVGYKAFSRKAVLAILPELRSNRFGIEPELAARVAARNLRVFEVGISYYGRTYEEGKKINWKDGLAAVYFIVRYGVEAMLRRFRE